MISLCEKATFYMDVDVENDLGLYVCFYKRDVPRGVESVASFSFLVKHKTKGIVLNKDVFEQNLGESYDIGIRQPYGEGYLEILKDNVEHFVTNFADKFEILNYKVSLFPLYEEGLPSDEDVHEAYIGGNFDKLVLVANINAFLNNQNPANLYRLIACINPMWSLELIAFNEHDLKYINQRK